MLFFKIANEKLIGVVEARHAHIPVAKVVRSSHLVYLSNAHIAINALLVKPTPIEELDEKLKNIRHCLAFYYDGLWYVIYEKLFRLEMQALALRVAHLSKMDAVHTIMHALYNFGTIVLPTPDPAVDAEHCYTMHVINAWADGASGPCVITNPRLMVGAKGESQLGEVRFYEVDRETETHFFTMSGVVKL